jgi:hypothetical protein
MGNALCLPRRGALQNDALQGVHDAAQGAWRAPCVSFQMETAEKLAEGFGSHTSFEAEHKQRGHDQAEEPGAACLRVPQRRLWVAALYTTKSHWV